MLKWFKNFFFQKPINQHSVETEGDPRKLDHGEKESTLDLAKIEIRVTESDGEVYVETLWAFPLGNNLFQLDNSPFYAYDVSWKDIVEAIEEEKNTFPVFKKVIEKSGHKTVRLDMDCSGADIHGDAKILKDIKKLGCSYEGATKNYISVDLPPEVNLEKVCDYLTAMKINWEHADPSFEKLYPPV